MKYMLLFADTAEHQTPPTDPAKAQAYMGGWMAYMDAMRAAGVLIDGFGLQGRHTATTLRVRDGKRQIQDGPFADTKEQLGGYFVIDVANLDAALDWAARSPAAATGAVEVRPTLGSPT